MDRRYKVLKSWLPKGKRTTSRRSRRLEPFGCDKFIAEIKPGDRTGHSLKVIDVDLKTADWTICAFNPKLTRKGCGLHTLAATLFGVDAALAARTIAAVIGAMNIVASIDDGGGREDG